MNKKKLLIELDKQIIELGIVFSVVNKTTLKGQDRWYASDQIYYDYFMRKKSKEGD